MHGGKVIEHPDGSKTVFGPVPKEKSLSDDEYTKLVIQKFAKKIESGWVPPAPQPGLFVDLLKLPTPIEAGVQMTLKEEDEVFQAAVNAGSAISMSVNVGSHIDEDSGEVVQHIEDGELESVSLVDGGLDLLKGLELSSLSEDDMDLIFPSGVKPMTAAKLIAGLDALGATTDPEDDDDEIQDTGTEPAYGISHDD